MCLELIPPAAYIPPYPFPPPVSATPQAGHRWETSRKHGQNANILMCTPTRNVDVNDDGERPNCVSLKHNIYDANVRSLAPAQPKSEIARFVRTLCTLYIHEHTQTHGTQTHTTKNTTLRAHEACANAVFSENRTLSLLLRLFARALPRGLCACAPAQMVSERTHNAKRRPHHPLTPPPHRHHHHHHHRHPRGSAPFKRQC